MPGSQVTYDSILDVIPKTDGNPITLADALLGKTASQSIASCIESMVAQPCVLMMRDHTTLPSTRDPKDKEDLDEGEGATHASRSPKFLTMPAKCSGIVDSMSGGCHSMVSSRNDTSV